MTMFKPPKTITRAARFWDALARYIITVGGVVVIGSVILILLLIVAETLPLFRPASVNGIARAALPEAVAGRKVMDLGVQMSADMTLVTSYLLADDGHVFVMNVRENEIIDKPDVIQRPGKDDARIQDVESFGSNEFSLLWSDGWTSLVRIVMTPRFRENGERYIIHAATARADVPPPSEAIPVLSRIRQSEDGSTTRAALLPGNSISIFRRSVSEAMFGDPEITENAILIRKGLPGQITALTMSDNGSVIYAGTDNGHIVRWDLTDEGEIKSQEIVPAFLDRRRITCLAMVFGDVSLAVGDAKGGLTTWFRVRTQRGWELRRIHELKSHESPVIQIVPSQRNKGLMSLSENGTVHLDHMTSERNMLSLVGNEKLTRVGYASRGNSMIGIDANRAIAVWAINNPHPETSWKTLFGKVHYEGYEEADFVWQTTGGEDFEAKFSLIPLLFGTFKGTVYAMFFSVPLALFAAVYVSKFTSHEFRSWIKPAVEIMAAVPSVVIGFLAALWLAPIFADWILTVFISLFTVPAVFVAFMFLWHRLRSQDWAKRVERGYEFLMLFPVVIAGVLLAMALMPTAEAMFFSVDMGPGLGMEPNFKLWLHQTLEMRYDQRNSIIIAFALGFAVIPIIFSIAEDSLTNVPRSLTAASLALGASRWQTVWRVVLPSASPGIFAAIMIGFGRAIGETMIVLMATGNTPIIDWSPFNGMRTLSANIAVEIPEAPVGGTLYRVLFLCAVLLFILTFFLNTLAEIVRDRLRRKYGRF